MLQRSYINACIMDSGGHLCMTNPNNQEAQSEQLQGNLNMWNVRLQRSAIFASISACWQRI